MIKLIFVFCLTVMLTAVTYTLIKENLNLKSAKIVLGALALGFAALSILSAITLLF